MPPHRRLGKTRDGIRAQPFGAVAHAALALRTESWHAASLKALHECRRFEMCACVSFSESRSAHIVRLREAVERRRGLATCRTFELFRAHEMPHTSERKHRCQQTLV